MDPRSLEDMIKGLSPALREEVEDFVHFLVERHQSKEEGTLRQDWAGDLRQYRDQYTSLELEQKALEWRGD